MKTSKELKERLISGLFTLVLVATMFIGLGSIEVQAAEFNVLDLKVGDSLKPGDEILNTCDDFVHFFAHGPERFIDLGYVRPYSPVARFSFVVQDTYHGVKISELVVTGCSFEEFDCRVYVNIVPADGNAPAGSESLGSVEVQNVLDLKVGDSLKPGDCINLGDYYIRFEAKIKRANGTSTFNIEPEPGTSRIVIKDNYRGQKIPEIIINSCNIDDNFISIYANILNYGGNIPAGAECIHDWNEIPAISADPDYHEVVCAKCGALYCDYHEVVCIQCGIWDSDCFYNGHGLRDSGLCTECGAVVSNNPTNITRIDYSRVFNSVYYAEANADLKAALGDDSYLLYKHFINSGMAEGRQANAEFNVHVYRQCNPDLVAALGDDLAAYYLHYINTGRKEGRVAK